MCGICGIYNFEIGHTVNRNTIQTMMNSMKHRGPDDEGIYIDNNLGLGFVRLSIIDLSPAGHQPMLSEEGRYVMVFNGEIYNYIELRSELKDIGYSFNTNTDSEVLLKSYMHWGEACLDRFNGMWAFMIYDTVEKTLFGARDRFGVKPFYYILNKNFFAFGSEISTLLSLNRSRGSVDNQAIFDYLVFNRTDQGNGTFYSDIKKVPHGSTIKLIDNRLVINKWYDLSKSIRNPYQSPGEFRDLFTESIQLRLRSDVPVGVCLSGGLDSSSIVSTLAKKLGRQDVHTFSAVYGKGETGDESEFINMYRSELPNMHFVTPSAETLHSDYLDYIKTIGEPTPSTAPYAQYKVMQLAKEHVVVTLDGQGADEQLAGYHYFYGFYFKELLKQRQPLTFARELFYYLRNHKSVFGLKSFIYFLLPASMKASLRSGEHGYLNKDFQANYINTNQITDNLYGAENLQDALIRHFECKLEHLLKWEDRNSMRFSLEARVPFLDYRLVERTLATQSSLIIKNGMTKHILRQAMKGILPEAIRNRRDKVGFDTPQDKWFRTQVWQEQIWNVLNNKSLEQYLDLDKCKSLYKRHLNNDLSIAKEIWKWINLAIWMSNN